MSNKANTKLDELYYSLNIENCSIEETAKEIVDIISYEFNDIETNSLNDIINRYFKSQLSKDGLDFYLENGLILDEKVKAFLNNFFNREKFIALRNKYDTIVLKDSNKLVSVIIATYNRKEMLIQAVESVFNQSYKNIEIIIVDDCSTDGTEQMVKDKYESCSSVVYSKNDVNKGPGLTRLRAYKEFCNGNYVVFMDDDDYFIDKDYFLKAVNLHEKEENLSFVAPSHFIYNYQNNKIDCIDLKCPERINNKEYFLNFNQKYIKPIASATMFNRKSLDNVKLEEMVILNDTTLFLRALLDGDAGFVDTIGLVYRLHGNNITYNLTCDFIIENLLEKIRVKELGIKEFKFKSDEMNEWLTKQLNVTISYYLKNSKVKLSDYVKLLSFLKINFKTSYNHFKIIFIKSVIHKLLKKWKKL